MVKIRRHDSRLSLLFELYAASSAARSLVTAVLDGSPLTPEEFAVYSVLFDEGPHGPTELAHRTGMPPTSMSHFVRGMLARGHATRKPSTDDRRSYRIVLTPAGLDAHAAAAERFAEADDRFVRALAADEDEARETLRAIGRAATTAGERLAGDAADGTA